MKKLFATLAIVAALLIGDGGTIMAQAADCPPTASYSEMTTRLLANNEEVLVADEKLRAWVDNANSLPAGFISQVLMIKTKDGAGFMHVAFHDNCLIAESVFHVTMDNFFSWLDKEGFSLENFEILNGA